MLAVGCAHFFYQFACPSLFMRFFCLDGSVSAPYIRCFAREHYDAVSEHSCFACTFLFYNVAGHHKLFPKNLPGDRCSLRRVLKGIRPTPCLKPTNKGGTITVRRIDK